MAGYKRIQRAILAITVVLILATACGRVAAPAVAAPGAAHAPQVIRDPDNPYFVGHVPTSVTTTTQVVRDPDNPYWIGNPNLTGAAAVTSSTARVIHDPDNPYWTGR